MIKFILPCEKCRINYKNHLRIYPISEYLNNKKSLFKWSVNMHNAVNKLNKKKECTLMEALNYYPCTLDNNKKITEKFLNDGGEIKCEIKTNKKNNNKTIIIIIFFTFIFLILFVFLYKKK